jgi:hypothetical protein
MPNPNEVSSRMNKSSGRKKIDHVIPNPKANNTINKSIKAIKKSSSLAKAAESGSTNLGK